MFNWFPYTNFHELNLDWILKKVKEFGETLSDFSDRLKKVEDNPSGYELPVASDDVLGGVKAPLKTAEQDPKVYIDADGYLYAPKSDSGVDSVNGKHGAVTLTNDDVNAPSKSAFETLENTVAAAYSPSNIPPYPVTSVNGKTGAVVIPTGGGSYELPVATSQTLGGVMPVSKTSDMTQEIGVDSAGKLWTQPSGGGDEPYVLPPASRYTLGGVKAEPLTTTYEKLSVEIDDNGKIWFYLPRAVYHTLGCVKPVNKGSLMTQEVGVDDDGRLWTTPTGGGGSYELPVATSQTLGGVMPTTKTSEMTQEVGVDSAGKLWVAPSAGSGVTIKTKSSDTTWATLSGDNIKTLFNFDPDISFMVVNIGLYNVSGGTSRTDVWLHLYDSTNTKTALISGLFGNMSGNTESLILQLVLRFSGTDKTIVQIDLVSASTSTIAGDPLIRAQSSVSLSMNKEGFVICPYTPTKLAISTINGLSIGNIHYECWYY